MKDYNEDINSTCKLYINEHTNDIKDTINAGINQLNARMLSIELAVKDINDIKVEMNAIKNGNGRIGHNALVDNFQAHIQQHEKNRERLWQVALAYGGKAALVIVNLFLFYRLFVAEQVGANSSLDKNHIEQKP